MLPDSGVQMGLVHKLNQLAVVYTLQGQQKNAVALIFTCYIAQSVTLLQDTELEHELCSRTNYTCQPRISYTSPQ